MYVVYIYALISVLVISIVSLIGLFTLSLSDSVIKSIVFILISLAAGTLLGDAFFHLIPESYESLGTSSQVGILTLIGILSIFFLEKFLHWHHCKDAVGTGEDKRSHYHLAISNLVGDGLHNLLDGMIIGASYMVSIEVGIATTLAILLHEIPQEIGDFGILVHAGLNRYRALALNFLSALLAVFGVVIVLLIGDYSENIINYLVPLAAGGFIYIAVGDLLPEIKQEHHGLKSLLQLIFIMLGIGIMYLLLLASI